MVRRHGAFSRFARPLWNADGVADAHPRDPQDFIHRFDIALDLGAHFVGFDWYLTHCQCAGKGAEQSTTDRGNDVIERRRDLLIRLDAVKLLDGAVHAEPNRLAERLDVRMPNRAFDPLDPDTAGVDRLRHGSLLLNLRRYHAVADRADVRDGQIALGDERGKTCSLRRRITVQDLRTRVPFSGE